MFDLFSANPMVRAMDRSMALASQRMGLIAGNLANVDTPGYHAQDLPFQEHLKAEWNAQQTSPLSLQRTHPGHQHGNQTSALEPPAAAEDASWERNDGNNVNLDRENLNLARTQSQYVLASSLLQTEVRRMYQVLREGSK